MQTRYISSDWRALSDNDIAVEVVLATPNVQYRLTLTVTSGCAAREVVLQAMQQGLLPPHTELDIDPSTAPLGVFAELVADDYCCQAGDRLEIYRPLQQDPKELRRQRARKKV